MFATPDKCKCVQLSDIVCLNRYYGWYVKGGYEISDAEAYFQRELEGWKKRCLDKPFIFTEYGADTDAALHKLPSIMWSQEYQEEYLEMCHRVFDSFDFIKGEQVWNFADFMTSEGMLRVNGNKKGIFTRDRQPKKAAFYFKKRWENLPNDYKGSNSIN
jgi:beta-glucuronidase